MQELYFADKSIIEQSVAMIKEEGKAITNGISIVVMVPKYRDAVEVLLEYAELKAALAELDANREATPHLYT